MMSMPSSVVPSGTVRGARPWRSLDGDRLGQVARLVDVRAARHGRVVGEQLERDDGQDGAERLDRLGHPQDVVGDRRDALVALGRDRDAPGRRGRGPP